MTSLITLSTDLIREAGGYTISIVSIIVVFVALGILVFIFMSIPKILEMNIKNKLKKAGHEEPAKNINVEGNVNVAIAMGLHLYFNELHDEESNIITIHNAPKQYSPWSSKIYSVQNQPVKK
ncbi:OadG family protein [uncultured Odoribacter sp.]|uniref:OadG family protein n=1 Tax=uncultured Odoribacter sp. TaxID=876416 RepID=UPI0026245E8C|nr:OadG family protein [uncultured Odoribacter sp.]